MDTTIALELFGAAECVRRLRPANKAVLSKLLREPLKNFSTETPDLLNIRVLQAANYKGNSHALDYYLEAVKSYKAFVEDCINTGLLRNDQILLSEDDDGFTLCIDKNALTFMRNHKRAFDVIQPHTMAAANGSSQHLR